MSRCFPFPPPGYEERVRPDEHLLKEEKRRDKKLKKEKKDKEKREGKDKRKREGDGRHKEKKHKKEKHRDKKEKHKDKKDKEDKGNTRNDNEKSSISEDASIVRAPETRSAEEVHMGEVYFVEKGCGINKIKVDSLCQRQDEQESIDQSLDRDTGESKFLQKVGRIRDEARATERTLGKSSGAYIIGNKEMHESALRDLHMLAEVKARNRDRRVDRRQEGGEAFQDRAQFSGTVMVRGLARSVDRKVEEMPGSVHNNSVRIVQGMPKCKEDGDHKRGEQSKRKDKSVKKNNVGDEGRENGKKLKDNTDNKPSDQGRSKISFKNGSPIFNNSNSYLLAVDAKVVSTEENVKKRKNVEAKGLVQENEDRHNKFPKVTLYLPKNNGQIARHPLGLPDSDRKGIPPQDKEDIKNCEVSGTQDAPSSYIYNKMPPSASATSCQLMQDSIRASPADKVVKASNALLQASPVVEASVKPPLVTKVIKTSKRSSQACQVEGSKKYHQVDEFVETTRKSPHPDMKCLSQISLVPEKFEVFGTIDSPSSHIYKQMPPSASASSCQVMEDSIEASAADKLVKTSSALRQASLVVEASVKPPLIAKLIKTPKSSSQPCQVVKGSKKYHQVDEFAEPSRKSPHPDMKHLSQVLLVPEKKEWPEVNDEDWLFSGKTPSFQNQKHVKSASRDYGQQHVWSESVHMESADLYALPYVIPY